MGLGKAGSVSQAVMLSKAQSAGFCCWGTEAASADLPLLVVLDVIVLDGASNKVLHYLAGCNAAVKP